MNLIRHIMEQINGDEPLIEIRDNESFSLPFVGELQNKIYILVFSYTKSLNDPDDFCVEDVFYIDLENPASYRQRRFADLEPGECSDSIFEGIALDGAEFTMQDHIDAYWELVDITDELLTKEELPRETVFLYAALFNQITPEALKKYYLSLGRDFFSWIEDSINR